MPRQTFKQFLGESMPTPGNVDGSFNVGNVGFDNKDGLGATPMGANVAYRGAVAWIKISKFRELAHAGDRSEDATKMVELIKSGKKIAAPFLIIRIEGEPDAPTEVKVIGHEGRARSEAVRMIDGDVYIPVQLHPQYLRARDLSREFFAWIEKNGMTAEDGTKRVKPSAKAYYLSGEEIKVS